MERDTANEIAFKLRDKIKIGEKKIEDAHKILIAAERAFKSVESPIEYEHKRILDNFMKIINDKISKEHTCEKCSPDLYDSAIFTDSGISMRIDAGHPNDIVDTDWTWEEVVKIMPIKIGGSDNGL